LPVVDQIGAVDWVGLEVEVLKNMAAMHVEVQDSPFGAGLAF